MLFDAGEDLSQQRLGLLYRRETGYGDLTLRNYYVWRDFANKLPFTSGGSVDLDRFYYGGGAQFTATTGDLPVQWTVGVDIDRQEDRRQRFDNNNGVLGAQVFDQQEDVSTNGLFLHAEVPFGDRWSGRAGVRYDDVSFDVRDRFLSDGDDSGSLDFDEFSYSLGVNYKLQAGTLFAAYSTSFETPTTTELANPDGSGGFNQDLDAQTADNVELGWTYARDGFAADIAVFRIDLRDELIPFELPAFPGRTFFANSGESQRTGLEVAARWQSDNGMGAQLSYTYSDFVFDDFTDDNGNDFSGNAIPGLPRHFAYASTWYEASSGFHGRFELRYSGDLYANNANDVDVDAYLTANLRLGYRATMGRWIIEPFFGVNNLFDESYNSNIRINAFGGRFFEPAPERNFYAGATVRFE